MNNMTCGSTAPPGEVREIGLVIEALEDQLKVLGSVTFEMVSAVGPILAPTRPETPGPTGGVAGVNRGLVVETPLGGKLSDVISQVNNLVEITKDVYSRVRL